MASRSPRFTISKGTPRSADGVIREVSSSGHTTKVMDAGAYAKAAASANRVLARAGKIAAGSALSQKPGKKS